MKNSKLINIAPDTEYNELMLYEKDFYYKNTDVNFYSNYKAYDDNWEWKEPTTPRKVFDEIIGIIPADKNRVFLDCGCGLGHVMYLATFHFNKVYGVEYISEVADIAEKNLSKLLPDKNKFKIFSCDMFELDKEIFNESSVFYISSPFLEEDTFKKLINIIADSLKKKEREIWIIYFYPYCENVMKEYHCIFPLVNVLETIGKVNYYHHV
jgi:SAM-dependent methyltransferase